MMWQLIGSAAAFLTMFSFVPQIVKVLRTRSAKDMSVLTLLQLSLGVALWIVYGIGRKDAVIIVANIVTLSSLLVLLWLYFSFRKDHRGES